MRIVGEQRMTMIYIQISKSTMFKFIKQKGENKETTYLQIPALALLLIIVIIAAAFGLGPSLLPLIKALFPVGLVL